MQFEKDNLVRNGIKVNLEKLDKTYAKLEKATYPCMEKPSAAEYARTAPDSSKYSKFS